MKHLEKVNLVECCNSICNFWDCGEEGNNCNHPFFDNKPYGSNNIILPWNNKSGFPNLCPLKHTSVTTITKLK